MHRNRVKIMHHFSNLILYIGLSIDKDGVATCQNTYDCFWSFDNQLRKKHEYNTQTSLLNYLF